MFWRCDLHLGDSQLQLDFVYTVQANGCDLHLGDSQLQ